MTKSQILVLSALIPLSAFAGSMDDTQNCVMVYVKNDASQPNLTVARDGERVLTHTVTTEVQLKNPELFCAQLYQSFQELVNSSGRKTCNQYDQGTVWWASCLTQ